MHVSTGINATNDGINQLKPISKPTSRQLVSFELMQLGFNAIELWTIGAKKKISIALALPTEPIAAEPSECDESKHCLARQPSVGL